MQLWDAYHQPVWIRWIREYLEGPWTHRALCFYAPKWFQQIYFLWIISLFHLNTWLEPSLPSTTLSSWDHFWDGSFTGSSCTGTWDMSQQVPGKEYLSWTHTFTGTASDKPSNSSPQDNFLPWVSPSDEMPWRWARSIGSSVMLIALWNSPKRKA